MRRLGLVRLHEQINLALWAGGAALFLFFLMHLPAIYAAQERIQISREQEVHALYVDYCKQFGFSQRTTEFERCITSLALLAESLRHRWEEDADF